MAKKRGKTKAGKTAAPATKTEAPAAPRGMHHSMSVRKISNGYLVSEYGHNQGKHYDRETFTKKAPKMPKLSGSLKSMEKKLGDTPV